MKHFDEYSVLSRAAIVFPELECAATVEIPCQEMAIRRKPALGGTKFKPLVSSARPGTLGRGVQVTTLSTSSMHLHGKLYSDLLRARKETFIDGRGWRLSETDGLEFDQYDTPQSRWVAIHSYGEILAGVRLTPTTARCGHYSYMIRDAQRGLLDDIPSDVLFFEAPVSPTIWEASRIFINNTVDSKRRMALQSFLISSMASEASKLGAKFVLGLVPGVWQRWVRRIGMSATAIGPMNVIEDSRCQAALMNCASLNN